jgi:hypothetical protein
VSSELTLCNLNTFRSYSFSSSCCCSYQKNNRANPGGPLNKDMLIKQSGASVVKGVCTLYSNIIDGIGVSL